MFYGNKIKKKKRKCLMQNENADIFVFNFFHKACILMH